MSIEVYLAVNLIVDLALLCAIGRSLGVFSWRRVLAADTLCAAYSVLAAARPMPWASPPVQLSLLAFTALLLTQGVNPRLWSVACAALCASALICGGTAWLLPARGAMATAGGVIVGTVLQSLLFEARPPDVRCWQIQLCLQSDGKTVRFPALVDTGNHLREPLSGMPVLIAEASLVRKLLPRSGYRVLRYGAVGGGGEMACFKPKEIWIERGSRRTRAPQTWVAVAPSHLPGRCQALAPSEFTRYVR